MKLDKVIFKVGDEERDTRCYQITAESGEFCFFWDAQIYPSLRPIAERQLAKANWHINDYKRDCRGRRYALQSASFWEEMLKAGGTNSTATIIFEEVKNDRS